MKERDVTSVSSSQDCATMSCDNVASSQSHDHLLTTQDGSTAYMAAQDIERVSPSSQDSDLAKLAQNSQSQEDSAVRALAGDLSESSISDGTTEEKTVNVSLQKTKSDSRSNDIGEICTSETIPVPTCVTQPQTTQTLSCGLQTSVTSTTELSREHTLPQDIHDLTADVVCSKVNHESASHVVGQSADLPQVSVEKSPPEAAGVTGDRPREQLEDMAVGVTTGQSEDTAVVNKPKTDPSQANIDLTTKSWFSLNATSPAASTRQSTATKQHNITPFTLSSDRQDTGPSHKINSPPESPDDFYSKYRHFSGITTDSDANISLEQALDYSAESDDSSVFHGLDAIHADTWSEFTMSDKFEGVLSLCMSERHLWVVDKHQVVTYSRTNKQQLNWRTVAEPAHQVAVSSSGAIVWRLYRGSVYVALQVTPTLPVGAKWTEVVREVKHIAVDDTVAW